MAAKNVKCEVKKESAESLGTVKIHEKVILAIVKKAALSVEGVHDLEATGLLGKVIGSKDGAVQVDMGENDVDVDVKVNLLMGAHAPTVAAKLQEAIANEVRKLAGLEVSKVNIHVMGLTTPPETDEIPKKKLKK